jgi:hypothetical protein
MTELFLPPVRPSPAVAEGCSTHCGAALRSENYTLALEVGDLRLTRAALGAGMLRARG